MSVFSLSTTFLAGFGPLALVLAPRFVVRGPLSILLRFRFVLFDADALLVGLRECVATVERLTHSFRNVESPLVGQPAVFGSEPKSK